VLAVRAGRRAQSRNRASRVARSALTAPFVLTTWLFLMPRQHLDAQR
jgi:hypothetical protein